jgi:hypothetical protein
MKNTYSTKNKVLILLCFFIAIKSFGQNYSVTRVNSLDSFNYLNSGTPSTIANLDDYNSNNISLTPSLSPLPVFAFNFYNNNYTSITVSTNGYISFGGTPLSTSPWILDQPITNSLFPVRNSILGCFHDLDNNNGQGTLVYKIIGAAPYRKFIVIFDNHSHYQCTFIKSSFQMVLHETSNIIDIILVDKQVCTSWNSGNAVSGLINSTGSLTTLAAPNRNTGAWTAHQEGYRFSRPYYDFYNFYSYVKCKTMPIGPATYTGIETFNLQVAKNDLYPTNPSGVSFYTSLSLTTPITYSSPNLYTNSVPFSVTNPSQSIYASYNGIVKEIKLSVVDCANNEDGDTVSNGNEDIDFPGGIADGNLANNDKDKDGIPNYLDADDDGDGVPTGTEQSVPFARMSSNAVTNVSDTDSDGIPNYLDEDDDNDGVLTYNEDYNNDGNPTNDDINTNGIPDYLDPAVALLNTETNHFENDITLYPNPATDILYIDNASSEEISDISIYAINGALIKSIKPTTAIESIAVSEMQSGIYFVKIVINNTVLNYKFIKK